MFTNSNKSYNSINKPSLSSFALLLSLGCMFHSEPTFAGTNAALFRVSLAIASNADRLMPQRDLGSSRFTWGAAEVSLMNAGYAKPKRVAVVNDVYWFNAINCGKPMTIGVAMSSGDIVHTYQAAN